MDNGGRVLEPPEKHVPTLFLAKGNITIFHLKDVIFAAVIFAVDCIYMYVHVILNAK